MKKDYQNSIGVVGRLKCPHCENSNMRKMFLEVSVGAQMNLVSGRISIETAPYNVHNTFDPIYCSVCRGVVTERNR